MLESAISQVENEVQRLEALQYAYTQTWEDSVSEKVFNGISTLASNASNLSSQLNTGISQLRTLRAALTQLTYL